MASRILSRSTYCLGNLLSVLKRYQQITGKPTVTENGKTKLAQLPQPGNAKLKRDRLRRGAAHRVSLKPSNSQSDQKSIWLFALQY